MVDTTVTDAVVFPQDDGTGVADGSEDFNSAGYFGLLAESDGTARVRNGLDFANIVTTDTSETVDVTAGHAFVVEGGNTVQSGSQATYDTTLPSGSDMAYLVVLPTAETGLALDTDVVNDLWVAVDPTTQDSVYIRHGNGLSTPTDPSVKLGTVDATDGSTTRANDGTFSGAEPFVYDPGVVRWGDGLTDQEVCRVVCPSGQSLTVERIEFRQRGGGSSANADVDVYDATAASVIGTQTLGGTTTRPGSSGAGNTVLVRISNSTGDFVNGNPRVTGFFS